MNDFIKHKSNANECYSDLDDRTILGKFGGAMLEMKGSMRVTLVCKRSS